jgi:hypothetical protein
MAYQMRLVADEKLLALTVKKLGAYFKIWQNLRTIYLKLKT